MNKNTDLDALITHLGGDFNLAADLIIERLDSDLPATLTVSCMIETALIGADDITAAHELIQTTHPDLATAIALRAELCDACSADAECCTCE